MELAGIAAGGNMRSMLSDFDIKNAAELEAHINMNAIAARANFDKYYRERLTDVSKLWRDVRRRLDVREPLEVPVFVLDVGTSKFDYTTISALFHEKLVERDARKVDRETAKANGDTSLNLTVNIKANMDDPFKLVITGCDYTNIDKVVANLKDNQEVTHLSLANNGLEPDDCDALATLIKENRTVISLDLSNNKLGGEGIAKLVEALKANTTIVDLDLGANQLAKSAGKALAEVLKAPTCRIARLQLAGNALGIYGAEELANGLKHNASVTTLGLQNNTIGNDGAEKVIAILPPPKKGGADVDEYFSQLAAGRTDTAMPLGLGTTNTTLVQVNLDANRIDDDPMLRVGNSTWMNEQLQQRLHWGKTESEARAILEGSAFDELALLELLCKKAHEELTAALAAKKEAEDAAAANKKAAPPPKGAKVPPKPSAAAPRAPSKSPTKACKSAVMPPAPAASGKVKAAATAGRTPSPKKSGK